MLDLSRIGEERRRWVSIGATFPGVEVEVRFAGPERQEKFRQKLIRNGVMRVKDGVFSINAGREGDWFKAFAEAFITDWRGDIKMTPEDDAVPEYTPELMARVLANHTEAFTSVSKAIDEEAEFFFQNGNGSTG